LGFWGFGVLGPQNPFNYIVFRYLKIKLLLLIL
jgi:hypothetical protein